jgi:hypothetical protein
MPAEAAGLKAGAEGEEKRADRQGGGRGASF